MFSWIATFDNEHNMTEVYKGSAPDESSAFKDMIAMLEGSTRKGQTYVRDTAVWVLQRIGLSPTSCRLRQLQCSSQTRN